MNSSIRTAAAYLLALAVAISTLGCGATKRADTPANEGIPAPVPSPTLAATPDALQALDQEFQAAYKAAAQEHLTQLQQDGPLIVNDLLSMTLYRSGGETESFTMNKDTYLLMARSAHPALAIYSLLQVHGFGPLSADGRASLEKYEQLLASAQQEAPSLPVDKKTRTRVEALLAESHSYVEHTLKTGTANRGELQRFAVRVRPLIRENLKVGAQEQLDQFKEKLEEWRRKYPDEHWNELRVVVLGFHQARDLYATDLFFRWLLREPSTEKRVVFAEVLVGKVHDEDTKTAARDLLGKVDLDRGAAKVVLGDETALGRDVMGPATQEILRSWPRSSWP
jgi:hypothetical protein